VHEKGKGGLGKTTKKAQESLGEGGKKRGTAVFPEKRTKKEGPLCIQKKEEGPAERENLYSKGECLPAKKKKGGGGAPSQGGEERGGKKEKRNNNTTE